MKRTKETIPAHVVLKLQPQGIFIDQGHLGISQMERKMKAAMATTKGGE